MAEYSVFEILERARQNQPLEPLEVRLTRWLQTNVADPKTHQSVFRRAARAVVANKIDKEELADILQTIQNRRPQIHSTGAYFTASLKRLFELHEITWD